MTSGNAYRKERKILTIASAAVVLLILGSFVAKGATPWVNPSDPPPPDPASNNPDIVAIELGVPQTDNSTNPTIWIEDSGGGDLLRLDNTTLGAGPEFVVGSDGTTLIGSGAQVLDSGGDTLEFSVEGDANANRLCLDGICRSSWADVLTGGGAGGTAGYIVKWNASGDGLMDTTAPIFDDGGGNIGINNTSPGFTLDVTGQANATELCIGGSCINSWGTAGTDSQLLYNEIATASGTVFSSDPTDRLTFQQGGGILISAVDGGVDADSVTFNSDVNVLQRRVTGSCGPGQAISGIDATGTVVTCENTDDGDWNIVGTDLVSAVSGNVGIGIASPTSKLHVGSVTRSAGFRFSDLASSHINVDGALYRFGGDAFLTVDDNFTIRDDGGTNAFHFQTDTQTLTIGSGGGGKLTVTTIDPVYTIGGNRYATYVAGMIGQKEEMTGTLQMDGGEAVLDFGAAPEGSDLWLFAKITNLSEHFDDLVVLLTPGFPGDVHYEINAPAQVVSISGTGSGEVSYRLTAPRLDADSLPTHLPPDPDVWGIIID